MNKDLKDNRDKGEVKTKLSCLPNSYVNSYKPTKKVLRKYRVLNKLRNNKGILITRPDKGNGVVILDRQFYMSKIYDIVNDESKFLKLSSDPTLLREGKLQRFLRILKNKDFFTKEQYDNIYPCGSQPARIYGTPKTHALKCPTDTLTFRPIVSSIGTYNYNLAKFLTDVLDPVIATEYCAKDSFSFCKEVQEVSSSNKFMISYDVCSLFTSIPLKETIDIAVNLIVEKYPDLKITRQKLKKLFEFATSGTHLLFDGSFYDQIDGDAMGSPLGPVLADLFMCFYEKRWLDQFQFCDVLFYRRYVDDIICTFNSEQDADEFFKFLNTQHPNIKFTFEKEKDGKLAFLDVLISKTDQDLRTSVYRKMTSVGLYSNFVSFTP